LNFILFIFLLLFLVYIKAFHINRVFVFYKYSLQIHIALKVVLLQIFVYASWVRSLTHLSHQQYIQGIHTISFKNSNPIYSSFRTNEKANYFLLIQKGKELKENLPEISYKKINPTKYLVNVENARDPFYLVQLENYDTYWNAGIDGNKLDEHKKVFGYANAWHIDEKGNYNVVIEYAPQKYFYFIFTL